VSLLILRLGFFLERQKNQVEFPMAGPHAVSQLNPDRYKLFGFSVTKSFQGASGATTSAANGFKFDATQISTPHQNHRLSHILTTRLISNNCDE